MLSESLQKINLNLFALELGFVLKNFITVSFSNFQNMVFNLLDIWSRFESWDFFLLNNPELVLVTELEKTVDVEFELVPVGVIRFHGALFLLIVGFYFLKWLPVKLIQVLDVRTDSQQHVRFKQVLLHVR